MCSAISSVEDYGMYDEDDLLPVSALAQLVYCERRCALIFLEGVWDENQFTAEGKIMHERVDSGGVISRPGIRTTYNVALRSLSLGLIGKADVVEFIPKDELLNSTTPSEEVLHHDTLDDLLDEIKTSGSQSLATHPELKGQWIPHPVEHKRGKLKMDLCYEVQLCAQALCLEEMLCISVPSGALYYGASHRRRKVMFDDTLRSYTEKTALRLHEILSSNITPKAYYSKKCDKCSLLDLCMPKATSGKKSVIKYLKKVCKE